MLDRQCLLSRSSASVVDVLEQIGGIQAQYAPSMYIGLWSRVEGFEREHLTNALVERTVVQGTLMRSTIHLVSRRDYWPCALAVRAARRKWYVRAHRSGATVEEHEQAAAIVLARLRTGPATRSEVADLIPRHVFEGIHEFADIVRVPPSGTWDRRRADLYGAAELWVGPEPALAPEEAVDHLVRRYLAAFGPARPKDIADWAGLPVTTVRSSLARLPTTDYVSEDGQPLVDLDGAAIPSADARGLRCVSCRRGTQRCSCTPDEPGSSRRRTARACSTRAARSRWQPSWSTASSPAHGCTVMVASSSSRSGHCLFRFGGS